MRNDPLHAAVQRVVSVRPDICSSAFEVFMFCLCLCLCLWRLASAPGVCIRIRMAGMFGSEGRRAVRGGQSPGGILRSRKKE